MWREASEPTTEARPVAALDWEQVLLGPALAGEPTVAADRRRLFEDCRQADLAATGLVGRWMMFRAAPAEDLAALISELGEAWYRWSNQFAEEPTALRDALMTEIIGQCAVAGVANTVELVRVGDRFDRTRHQAAEHGLQVTQVNGWVVLRHNGSVYTRAQVAVG